MNRNHLALFAAVAEAGGFSAAAEKLLLTQPAVSQQVAELERSLGLELFDRLPRGVRLTAGGELLFGFAQKIAALEGDADSAVRAFRGLERGKLVVGASLTVGSYILPAVLATFHAAHPQIDVEMEIANTDQINARLESGEFEIGLTEGFEPAPSLKSWVFGRDELMVIAAPSHPLTKRKRVVASDLREERFILREAGSGTRAVVERALRSRGITPIAAMSLGSMEAIKSAVAAGLGIGVVSSLGVTIERQAGVLAVVKLADLRFTRNLHAATLRGKSLSPAAKALIDLLPRVA